MREANAGARALELRKAFDASFAEARRLEADAFEDFLSIRLGDRPYAVRLAQVSRLAVDHDVTPLPEAPPELVGVGALGERLLAVYDLGSLVGVRPPASPRWLLVSARREAAFAFDEFEGHLRLPAATEARNGGGSGPVPASRRVIEAEGLSRPVVDLESIIVESASRLRPTHLPTKAPEE